MTEQQKIELAEQYYEQGKYSDMLDICIELIKGGEMENPCKVHTLSAKGLLGISYVYPDESQDSTFKNQITQAYITANSALEQLWVRREIAEAIVKWTKPALQHAVDEFRRKPSKGTMKTLWKALNPTCYGMLHFEALWLSMPMNNPYKATEEDNKKANELYGKLI